MFKFYREKIISDAFRMKKSDPIKLRDIFDALLHTLVYVDEEYANGETLQLLLAHK